VVDSANRVSFLGAMEPPEGWLRLVEFHEDTNLVGCEDFKDGTIRCFIRYPEWMRPFLEIGRWVTVIGATRQVCHDMHTFDCTDDGTFLIPHPHDHGALAEGFAGLGGWTKGAAHIGGRTSLAIEIDETTAKAYSFTHGVKYFTIDDAMTELQKGVGLEPCVIKADILDWRVWQLAGCMNVSTWMMSPPCPPWCSSGRGQGLNNHQGRLLPLSLERAAACGVRFVLMENTANIVRHADFQHVKATAKSVGLRLIVSQIDDPFPVVPCQRRRWMAIFVSHHVSVCPKQQAYVSSLKWPTCLPGHDKPTISLLEADAIHVNITQEELHELTPTPKLVDMMKNPELVVPFLRKPGLTVEATWKGRIVQPTSIFKAIMASYGHQDDIPYDLLQAKGLHAFVIMPDGTNPTATRLASPWEFIAAMGFGPETTLPFDLTKAWTMAGNALTPTQAALTCLRCFFLCGAETPFRTELGCMAQIAKGIRGSACKLSKLKQVVDPDWRFLIYQFEHPIIEEPNDWAIDEYGDISPTLPYKIDDDLRKTEIEQNASTDNTIVVAAVGGIPKTVEQILETIYQSSGACVHRQNQHVPWIVQHHEDLAIYAGWTNTRMPVSRIIQKVWPQARECDFLEIHHQGKPVLWSDVFPTVEHIHLVAVPKKFPCTVNLPNDSKVVVSVDCSWILRDVMAYVAVSIGCLPNQLWMENAGFVVNEKEPLSQHGPVEFDIVPYVRIDEMIHCVKGVQHPISPPSHTDACYPTNREFVRFTIRHPVWSTIRTTALHQDMKATDVLRQLFPDLSIDDVGFVTARGPIDKDEVVTTFKHDDDVAIHFCGSQCFPDAPVSILSPLRAMTWDEALSLVNRWVRTPFNHRACEMKIPGSWTLLQLGATHFLCTTSTQSILPLVNGKHVDPRLLVKDTLSEDVITFRVCPLLGGDPTCRGDRDVVLVGFEHPVTHVLHVASGCSSPDEFGSFTNVFQHTRGRNDNFVGNQTLTIEIQGPFDSKAKRCCVDINMTVGHWILQQLPEMQREVQIIVLQNGVIISPGITFGHCNSEAPLRCRWGKPPGGTKKNELLKNKLKQCLGDHGVPEDKVNERVEAIIGGVGADQIRSFESTDKEQFWQHLKKAASDARVRLVTPGELKEFQHKKRSQHRANGSQEHQAKKHQKKNSGFDVPPIETLKFDATHFTSGEEIVPIIPSTKFGPDAKGLVIMSVEQALLHINDECLSFEPLAILAIGRDAERVGTKVLIPAHTTGAAPVLVPGALVQFGEEVVEFKANIPSVNAETIDTVTLEFTLQKKLLPHWESTANPLYYLGLQCPELRATGRTLSSWSVKSYKDRKHVNFNEATSWHGYLKIDFRHAEAVLRRSGTQGMFFTPRGADRRPDGRFAVVAMPNETLEGVLKIAADIPDSIGVAVLGSKFDAFGIRCKRDAFEKVREVVFPESIKIDVDDFSTKDDLYTIRHLKQQFTRETMNKALQGIGWTAKAIKPVRDGEWLVASATRPPSEHLCINGSLAIVVAKHSDKVVPLVLTRTDTMMQVVNQPDGTVAVSKHNRVDEIRADITEFVDKRLEAAHQQIEQLTHALQSTQQQIQEIQTGTQKEFDNIRQEQAATLGKVGDIEKAVTGTSNQLLSQMKEMFDTFHKDNARQFEGVHSSINTQMSGMQTDLSSRIEAIEREQGKRHKC